MNLQQIKTAVDKGLTVYCGSSIYVVVNNGGSYAINCVLNEYSIGLTWLDGVTLNGSHEDFYLSVDRELVNSTSEYVIVYSKGNPLFQLIEWRGPQKGRGTEYKKWDKVSEVWSIVTLNLVPYIVKTELDKTLALYNLERARG